MTKHSKTLLATLFLLSLLCTTFNRAKAQGIEIQSEILPSQGSAGTTFLIRFITLNASVGDVQVADIFWDESALALSQNGTLGADHSYNYNITVPNEPPQSNVGNHTIRVDSYVLPYGPISFNFTFTITEFVPSPEYLALNETYYSLLANYTYLLTSYTQLLSNYTTLSANFTTLVTEHDQLLLNYNSLSANYNSLLANNNALTANYNSLSQTSSMLLTDYASLQTSLQTLTNNYSTLTQDYSTLIQDYSHLNSSYSGLLANYNALTGQLDFTRNLNYIFIITTIVLAITTAYFVAIKPKRTQKAR